MGSDHQGCRHYSAIKRTRSQHRIAVVNASVIRGFARFEIGVEAAMRETWLFAERFFALDICPASGWLARLLLTPALSNPEKRSACRARISGPRMARRDT